MQDNTTSQMSELFILNNNKKLDLLFNSDERFSAHRSDVFSSQYYDESELFNQIDSANNITALSSNIQSLPSKFDALLSFLSAAASKKCSFDIIALQEIWQLKDPSLFQIQDYIYFGNERKKCKGGGVGFFIKQKLGAKKLKSASIFIENIFESLVVEVTVNMSKKIVLANIYRPNNHKTLSSSQQMSSFFEEYEEFIDKLAELNKPVYIFADMNIDLLKLSSDFNARTLIEMSDSIGLNQLVTKATRIQGSSYSLIDHIYTNVEDSWSGVLVDSFSDHFSTVCKVMNKSVKSKSPPNKQRNFSKKKLEDFRNVLNQTSWASVYASSCPNESWEIFWEFFYTTFNLYFPIINSRKNKSIFPMKPFMTQGLLNSRNQKFKLDLIRKNNPTTENIQAYKKYITIYSKTLKLSKKKYFEDKFRKHARNPKKTWEIINEVSNKSNSKRSFADFIEVDNRIIQSPEKMADAFNKYFSEAGINVAKNLEKSTL